MAPTQRLILEDADTTYRVLIESTQPIQPSDPSRDDLEAYDYSPQSRPTDRSARNAGQAG